MLVTAALLTALYDNKTVADFVDPLNRACQRYSINTPLRVAHFLAQIGHESGSLRYTVENLNYSADALRRVFGKYFPTAALANAYARKPVLIASRVYANRMGNGDEASQEGWVFRGKGLIQLTGRLNHQNFATAVGMSLEEATAYLLTTEGACLSAAWFWSTNGLNALADRNDHLTITRRINGGTNGLQERTVLLEKARRLLRA